MPRRRTEAAAGLHSGWHGAGPLTAPDRGGLAVRVTVAAARAPGPVPAAAAAAAIMMITVNLPGRLTAGEAIRHRRSRCVIGPGWNCQVLCLEVGRLPILRRGASNCGLSCQWPASGTGRCTALRSNFEQSVNTSQMQK